MPIIPIVIKASLLLGAALAGTRWLRAAPASARHALWSVTFAALLALPWLGAVLPALDVPLPAAWAEPAATPIADADAATPDLKTRPTDTGLRTSSAGPPIPDLGPRISNAGPRIPDLGPRIPDLVRLAWLAGAMTALGALLLSLWRVHRLTRTAADVTDVGWLHAAQTIGARLALRRPARVLVSDAVRTPMAGGLWRPVIFLPKAAESWTAERRDVVLAHELSHIAGRDPLRHLGARLAVGCYWFHPLAWLAAHQASLAREQACDEAVLALGIRPSDYARVLLDLADTMAPQRTAAALPMVERSLLETRVMSILDHRTRPSRLYQSVIPVASTALLALVLAAARPAARDIDVRSPTPTAPMSSSASPVARDLASPAVAQTSRELTCAPGAGDFEDGVTYTGRQGNGDRIIRHRFGDLRVCMAALGVTYTDRDDGPTAWAGRAPHVVIDTVRGGTVVHLDIRRQGGTPQTSWTVNGVDRPFDGAAQAWRDAVLAVLDRTWEVSTLQGQEASLRGDIASLRGDEASLRGDIASIHGDIASLRGEQASIRGDESSLRGDISSIQGHVSSLRGDISSERGAISSIEGSRYGLRDLNDTERARLVKELKAHEDEIDRLERELRDYDAASKIAGVEKQIRALDADGKIAALEEKIRTFDERGKTAAIEKRIEALNVEGKTAEIEKRIQALDAGRRSRQIKDQLDEAVKRLQQALAAIR